MTNNGRIDMGAMSIYDQTAGWITTITNNTGNSHFSNSNLSGSNNMHVTGDCDIDGDLRIAGKSIMKSLEKIEQRLAILHPNEELEEKWENLRGLRKMYMELEAEIKEKEAMWSILKK